MKTIMVVDDEKDIRESVKTLLEQEGYKIITASSADDCLEKLKESQPDLILMDIMMPGTPVREAIQQIKGVKVAFLSVVRTTEAEKEEIISDNVVAYIQKPFDVKTLLKEVKRLVG